MKQVFLEHVAPEEETSKLAGKFLGEDSYDLLVGQPGSDLEGPVEVFLPDGELLLRYLPNVLDAEVCKDAWAVLRKVPGEASNRSTAAGVKAVKPIKSDGTQSKTIRVPTKDAVRLQGVGSAIIGAFERANPRFPTCRLTAFNLQQPQQFESALPFIRAIDGVFEEHCPERHAAQMEWIQKTHPAWTIHGTSFTTVTVNRQFRTAVHTDRGDLKEGFGVLSALRAGHYEGCYLVFPAFRVAVDMHTRGVLLCDVHQWHGNTPLVGKPGRYERVSCVFYYRERMIGCKSPEEETEFAASRGEGEPMWRPGELDIIKELRGE